MKRDWGCLPAILLSAGLWVGIILIVRRCLP
jgi:hypothetical protein